VGTIGANIEEVEHQRACTTLTVQNAQLEMVLQTRGLEHIEQVIKVLRDAGLRSKWIATKESRARKRGLRGPLCGVSRI
jgi:threonine dehydratase